MNTLPTRMHDSQTAQTEESGSYPCSDLYLMWHIIAGRRSAIIQVDAEQHFTCPPLGPLGTL
jgi:hypothetical protein